MCRHTRLSLFEGFNWLTAWWEEFMKSMVEVPGHFHQGAKKVMSVLSCFVDVLLQSYGLVPAIVEVLLIDLATVMLVNVPTVKHQNSSSPFIVFNTRGEVNVKPTEQGLGDIGEVVKALLQ